MLCLDSQERNWEWFYDNGCISIGYNELNDISNISKRRNRKETSKIPMVMNAIILTLLIPFISLLMKWL